MIKIGCLLLICLGVHVAQAQLSFQLSGKITDTTGAALAHATINIITSQDTLRSMTKDDGSFILSNLLIRKFKLWVTMKGHLALIKSYALATDQRSVQLGTLVLKVDYSELDPITIIRVRPVTFQEDTVSYNVAAFPVRDGAEVEAILKRLPGIEIDMNGNIIVQGKKVQKVTVNGKDFFGGDVLLAIRNLPADVVDKLQIIDDYGDKAKLTGIKSGGSSKVLNIITKADKRNGEFGNVQTGGGDYGQYSGEAFANAFKGDRQISANAGSSNISPTGNNSVHHETINYADQWNQHWAGSINYNTTGQDSHTSGSSIQDNFYSGEKLHQANNSQTSITNKENFVGINLTYKRDNYSILQFNGSVNQHSSVNQSSSSFTTSQQDGVFTKSTTGSSLNKSELTEQSLNSIITYETFSSHSRKRFSTQLSVSNSKSQQAVDNQSNAIVTSDSTSTNSQLHYLVNSTSPTFNVNQHSTYFLPLGLKAFLELGYSGQFSQSQIQLLTQQPSMGNGPLITVDSLSQHQTFRTFTQNFHVGYTRHFHKLDLTASLDGQPGMMEGSTSGKGNTTFYHYFSLVPRLEGTWVFNKSQKINFIYSSQPNLPGLNQLAPFTNLTNPQYPVTGNPNLKPSHTNVVSLHYEQSYMQATQFSGFGVSLGYSNTEHSIVSNITHPKDSSQVIQQMSYVNAGTTSSIHADYHINFPSLFKKRFRITSSGSYSLVQTPTMTDGFLYNSQTLAWNVSLHLQLLIPDVIEGSLQGNYSVIHSVYPGSDSLPNVFKTASLSINIRQYLLKHWILGYQMSQPFTSKGSSLQQAPTDLSICLQREFLRHNKATISINGYNLLNSTVGVSQSSSPTGITQTRTQYVGRYFFCSFLLKLSRFKN